MADRGHFNMPIWKQLLDYFDVIDNSVSNALDLACATGNPVLIFPLNCDELLNFVPAHPIQFKTKQLLHAIEIAQLYGYCILM
jgi:hypothetical protein